MPATTVPATTVPATTVPATTVPATTVPATTAPPNTTNGERKTVDDLAALVPTVDGYEYSKIKQSSIWGFGDPNAYGSAGQVEAVDEVQLQDLATTMSRPVYVEGGDPEIGQGWVGEVSVFDAGVDTLQLWMDFVDYHRVYCLTGPSLSDGTYVTNTVPGKWQAIGNEIVLTGVADPNGDIGAAWFHDGLIWAVSGWSSSRGFVEGLIAEQEATGVEPEQIDVDALEGALADVIVGVPGFQFYDSEPAEVLSSLEGAGNCVEHLSAHSVVLTDTPDVGVDVWMYGLAAPCREDLDESTLLTGWTRQDINGVPAAISGDGTEIVIAPDTGVLVSVVSSYADDLRAFTPVLEMLADTAAATEI